MPYPRKISMGRVTIGLYNSYDPTRFVEAHRRVIARAGPLCLAFDFNLALFGFPFADMGRKQDRELKRPEEVAGWLCTTTSIGEDGRYTRELAGKGRFHIFDLTRGGFPPQLGKVVLTTSKPDERKSVSVEGAVKLSMESSICLVFGLGPHGVPGKVFHTARHHMDVTGTGRSLETCTALGAVAGAMYWLRKKQTCL